MIDGNNSENQDWDLTHKLARMHTKGNDSITKEEALREVRAEIQRRFVPDDLLNKIITFIDEDKFDALEREIFSSELTERIKQQIGNSNWFDSLEKELLNALRSGEIKCLGINSNTCKREEITAIEWVDLKFYYGVPTLQVGPKYCTLGTRWYRLEFPAESIQKVWPIPNSVNSHKNQEEQTDFPLDTKWEDMTWTFLSNELVRVEAKGFSKKYQYSELGFTDKRKGDTPDTRWSILKTFAKCDGEIGWDRAIDTKQKNIMSAAVRDIRKRLKTFFNINDDPFHPYRKTNSYLTKFTIKDNRDIDNTDNSEPDGFSLEEVKEHLNNSQ